MDYTTAIKELHTGLPASIIADMLLLPSLSVIRCLSSDQECQPGTSECERLEKLHPILRDASDGHYRSIFRIWKAKGRHGITLADLCCADELDIDAIQELLSEFAPAIDRYTRQDTFSVSTPITRSGWSSVDRDLDMGVLWAEWIRR